MVRRKTSEETLRRRASCFNRDDQVREGLVTQNEEVKKDIAAIREDIKYTEELMKDELLHQLLMR